MAARMSRFIYSSLEGIEWLPEGDRRRMLITSELVYWLFPELERAGEYRGTNTCVTSFWGANKF